MRVRRIEAYSFSTPFGQRHSLRSESDSKALRVLTKSLPDFSSLRSAATKKPSLSGRLFMLAVRVRRIELPTTAWKAVVLPLNYTRK